MCTKRSLVQRLLPRNANPADFQSKSQANLTQKLLNPESCETSDPSSLSRVALSSRTKNIPENQSRWLHLPPCSSFALNRMTLLSNPLRIHTIDSSYLIS
uniref:Uncharacterized protein n=1 Tax=Solanum tuberosum TaxID=4113 RepID=M1ACX4_SOLTU